LVRLQNGAAHIFRAMVAANSMIQQPKSTLFRKITLAGRDQRNG